MVAYVEEAWADAVSTATLYRYELPPEPFESLDDAGMWVSRSAVRPLRRTEIGDLAAELRAARRRVAHAPGSHAAQRRLEHLIARKRHSPPQRGELE